MSSHKDRVQERHDDRSLTVLDDGKLIHRWIGYGVLALVAVRPAWGVVRPATFRPRGIPIRKT